MPTACISTLFQGYNSNKLAISILHGKISPLSCDQLNTVLYHLLQQAGLTQSNYASHSFRIGAATTATAAGLPTWLIMRLGQWINSTYRSYIHHSAISTISILRILSRTDASSQPPWNSDQ